MEALQNSQVTLTYGFLIIIDSLLYKNHLVSPTEFLFPGYEGGDHSFLAYILPFLFLGSFDIHLVVNLLVSMPFLSKLEQKFFSGKRSHLIFIMILSAVLIGFIAPIIRVQLVGIPLLFTFITIYSKLESEQVIRLYGVQLPMRYYPYIQILVQYLLSGNCMGVVFGLFIGHFVFYILYIFPVITGKPLLRSPPILEEIFGH